MDASELILRCTERCSTNIHVCKHFPLIFTHCDIDPVLTDTVPTLLGFWERNSQMSIARTEDVRLCMTAWPATLPGAAPRRSEKISASLLLSRGPRTTYTRYSISFSSLFLSVVCCITKGLGIRWLKMVQHSCCCPTRGTEYPLFLSLDR